MRNLLSRAWKRFDSDQAGNAAVLFAFSAIPLIGLLGGAVDVSRHVRYKMQIQNAMDSAVVALVRRGARNDADADRFVNEYIATLVPQYVPATGPSARKGAPGRRDAMLQLAAFDATQVAGGYRISSNGDMETAFLPVVGIDEMSLDLTSEASTPTGKYEVALALDNTGSMDRYGRMKALRDAAGKLVKDLYEEEGTEDRVKMALVPFVTAVNIKTPGVYDEASWIDPKGSFDLLGMNTRTPADRLALFQDMRVEWKGCVEARAGVYDEDDTPPSARDRATRWVPYLWPDEPKGYGNNYIEDKSGGSDLDQVRNTAKYQVPGGTKVTDTTEAGPNAACPRAIVELTNDKARMQREIELMKPHNEIGEGNHSGTNVAQGLAWAWRVLSNDAPFEQGVPYSDAETTKVLVLLSDGRNQVVGENNAMRSDYTGSGYLVAGRMGSSTDYLAAERAVDAKVKRICDNIKARNIRLYMVLFQVDYPKTQDLFRDCASKDEETGEPLFYYVPEPEQLETAFADIGKDLTNIHISR